MASSSSTASNQSAADRLATFRARTMAGQQHSPIKTRAFARRILSEQPTGNVRPVKRGKGQRELTKTTSDPGPVILASASVFHFPPASPSHFSIAPTASTSLAPPISPYKSGSPGKRPRSPDEDRQASPAKRQNASPGKSTLSIPLSGPIRSPPRLPPKSAYPSAFALSPPPPALTTLSSPTTLDDPFSASPSPPLPDGQERALPLWTRSVASDLPLMKELVAANQPEIRVIDSLTPGLGDVPLTTETPLPVEQPKPLSPSQRVLLAMHTPGPTALLAPVQATSTPTPSLSALAPAAEITSSGTAGRSLSSGFASLLPPAPVMTPTRREGQANVYASLGVAGSKPYSPGLSPRRTLQRSKSTSSLGDEVIDPALLITAPILYPLPTPAASTSALAPTPVVSLRLPTFNTPNRLLVPSSLGLHHSPSPLRRSPLSSAELSAIAARPSGIPRLALITASPAPSPLRPPLLSTSPSTSTLLQIPDEELASYPQDFVYSAAPRLSSLTAAAPPPPPAGVSDDMAARLARMQGLMSQMGPSRRRSAPPPPKTPLTGGHALRRRVSASEATSPSASSAQQQQQQQQQVTRKTSSGNMRRGSLLPLASASGAAAEVSSSAAGKTSMATPLVDVVAFVDVRTAEGDDAGQVFVDMLRSLGARVVAKYSAYVTHVVYKSGKPVTLQRVKAVEASKRPNVVGVGWVVKCREKGERLPEVDFAIEARREPSLHFQKRRKSMEPRNVVQSVEPLAIVKPLAAVERAKRLSMQFAPKIGSPLSKRMATSSDAPEPLKLPTSSPVPPLSKMLVQPEDGAAAGEDEMEVLQ